MSLGFFCLALFLYLSIDPDSGYTSASAAPSGKEGVEISFGSAIKLMHEKLGFVCIPTMCRMDPAVVSNL